MKLQLTLVAGLVASQFAVAEDNFRQHDAHVHGHVEFNIAQDGQDLLIEITAPGADVVGFEHAPKTDADKAKLETATSALLNVATLFDIPAAAGCKVVDAHVEHSLNNDSEHRDHDDHGHHDDGKHHDEHDHHDDHKAHDDHHDHDHDDHDRHGEFTAQYQFSCADFSKVNQIDSQWFKHFPATEKVSVNLLTDKTQSATELTSGSNTIKF